MSTEKFPDQAFAHVPQERRKKRTQKNWNHTILKIMEEKTYLPWILWIISIIPTLKFIFL